MEDGSLSAAPTTCVSRPSRFVRSLQVVAALFSAVFSLLPTFAGGANLFFYRRDVTCGVDWLLLGTGSVLCLLALLAFAKPLMAGRWLGMVSVIGFAIVLASGTGLLSPINADTNIALMCAASFFFVFLMSRYLSRPHYPSGGPACSHCSH